MASQVLFLDSQGQTNMSLVVETIITIYNWVVKTINHPKNEGDGMQSGSRLSEDRNQRFNVKKSGTPI
jgi:hypothetical protein